MSDPTERTDREIRSALAMSRAADGEAAFEKFEVGKTYRTRGGRRTVEILAIRNELEQPIIGLETDSDGNRDLQVYWSDGRFPYNREQSSLDIIPADAELDEAERQLIATLSSIARAADGATTLRQIHLSGIALELEKQRRAIALVREETK